MHYFTHVSKQDQKSIRYDSILQWLQMAYGISLSRYYSEYTQGYKSDSIFINISLFPIGLDK